MSGGKKVFAMILAPVFVLGGAVFLRWANQPISGVISSPEAPLTEVLASSSVFIEAENATFNIPAGFSVKQRRDAAKPFLEQIFTAKENKNVSGFYADQIAITVVSSQDLSLAESPDVQLRQNKENYDSMEPLSSLAGGLIYSKKDSTEVTAFFEDQTRWASISVSGVGTSKLREVLGEVVASWRWRQ